MSRIGQADQLHQGSSDARYLQVANNLSDLSSAAAARTNLGLVAGGAGDIWVEKAGDTMTGALVIGLNSSTALTVGLNGATNPALQIDTSTASSATGLKIKSAAAAGGVALSVITSGTNENLTIDAAGSGTITIAGTSTGAITLTRATTVTAALTVTPTSNSTSSLLVNDSTSVSVFRVDTTNRRLGIKVTAPAKSIDTLGSLRFSSITAPTAPSVALAGLGAGNLTNGAYTYKVVYVTGEGDTAGGTVSSTVTVTDATTNGQVALTSIPVSASSYVTARKIYRTAAAGTVYKLQSTINDNTTTTATDNVSDASLGANLPIVDVSTGIIYRDTVPIVYFDAASGGSFLGVSAGNLTHTGVSNVGIGGTTLLAVTTGANNTAVGVDGLKNLTTGSSNVSVGNAPMFRVVTGDNNVAVGANSNFEITSGSQNVGIGAQALKNNVTGSSNVAIGYQAMQGGGSSSRDQAIAIGPFAFLSLTTGSNNIAIGYQAGWAPTGNTGFATTTGAANLFLGYRSGAATSSQTDNAIAIGPDAVVTASNTAVIGATGTKYKLGISVANPTNDLSYDGTAARIWWMERHTTSNTAGNSLTIQSGGATSGATDKNAGTLTLASGIATGTGTGDVVIQTSPPQASTNTTDNAVATIVTFKGSGNVGIGVTSPTAVLHLKAGTATANTAPLKFNTGTNLTVAVAGAIEFTTDLLYFTGTTGPTRKVLQATNTGRSVAQNAAVASVAAYTIGASDASFIISMNVLVTTSTLHNFTCECAYTDESNVARVLTLNFTQLAGNFLTAITNVTGAGPYEGVPLHIRAKASTTITLRTQAAGTYTTVTFNVEGLITQSA